MDYRVAPGTDMTLKLEGNDIAAGDLVRVELWDNQDDEDVNAAVLGEELKVHDDGTIRIDIPAEFPKTNNAFLRIYYKCHNAVSHRFSIKAPKNCMHTKVPHKPTEGPTPIIIYKPTPAPTPIIIHAPEASIIHPTPIAPSAIVEAHAGGPAVAPIVIATTPVRPTSIKSSVIIKSTSSASTSTSSASVAKFSAGSVAIAMAIAFAMLLQANQ